MAPARTEIGATLVGVKIMRESPPTVDVDGFLGRPLFARLATESEEGPRDSPVWFFSDDDAVWIIGVETYSRLPAA
jgi:hypothetical protein